MSGRANYGIDAPGLIRNFVLAGVASLVMSVLFYAAYQDRPALAVAVLALGVVWGILGLGLAGFMVWSSKVGKLRERERILSEVPWRGDEVVLDAGCGRGLFLVGAARRLKAGRAVGMDAWQMGGGSGKNLEAAAENARAEGVEERVEIRDGDLLDLPFEDGSFDLVISGLALHHIENREEREGAVRELVRVLGRGGHLLLVDISNTEEYARVLRECRMADVRRSGLRFGVFPPVREVMARKPGGSSRKR